MLIDPHHSLLVKQISEQRIILIHSHHAGLTHPMLLHHHARLHAAAALLLTTALLLHGLLLLHSLHNLLLLRLHAPHHAWLLLLLQDLP